MLLRGFYNISSYCRPFFTVACTRQITALNPRVHSLLCLVILSTAVMFMTALKQKKKVTLPRMTNKELFGKCL